MHSASVILLLASAGLCLDAAVKVRRIRGELRRVIDLQRSGTDAVGVATARAFAMKAREGQAIFTYATAAGEEVSAEPVSPLPRSVSDAALKQREPVSLRYDPAEPAVMIPADFDARRLRCQLVGSIVTDAVAVAAMIAAVIHAE